MEGNMLPDINLGTGIVVENLQYTALLVDKDHDNGHKRDQHPSTS